MFFFCIFLFLLCFFFVSFLFFLFLCFGPPCRFFLYAVLYYVLFFCFLNDLLISNRLLVLDCHNCSADA